MIQFVNRKSMKIRPSGRSTDFISPSFGHGCLFNCSYCYMKRHKPEGLSIAKNTDEILEAIDNHASTFLGTKIPNQTHEKYWTYDISCNEDFILHLRHHDWLKIFSFFRDHDKIMASMATKYVNQNLLKFDPKGKIRVRMSLMPEKYRKVLEPNTTPIYERIKFANDLIEAGYDVHVNFSPVIVFPGALDLYKELFMQLDEHVLDKNKAIVKAEVIFLTHNIKKHLDNVKNNLPGEELLWRPEIQEFKTSQYGGKNLRYQRFIKSNLIKEFKRVHNSIIPWNKIRYIF